MGERRHRQDDASLRRTSWRNRRNEFDAKPENGSRDTLRCISGSIRSGVLVYLLVKDIMLGNFCETTLFDQFMNQFTVADTVSPVHCFP